MISIKYLYLPRVKSFILPLKEVNQFICKQFFFLKQVCKQVYLLYDSFLIKSKLIIYANVFI